MQNKHSDAIKRKHNKIRTPNAYLSSSSLSEGMLPGPPKTMPPDVGGGGIELKGQAFRGEDCLCGGEWEVASSFKSASLVGELEDEGTSRIFLRLAFFETATGFGSSSVASTVSSSREVAEGSGESSNPFGSRSRTVVSTVGPFSGRGGRRTR